MHDNSHVIIVYYEGAYGPTIRINTSFKEELIIIRDIFSRLKNEYMQNINFKDINNVEIKGFNTLIFEVAKKKRFSHSKMNKELDTLGQYTFKFTLMREEYEQFEGLIDGLLLDDTNSGHQYLLEDEVLIELAFLE